MTTSTLTLPTSTSFADVKGDDRLQAMRAEIDAGVAALSDPQSWTAFLESSAKFHQYSFGNQQLVAIQRPDATRVAGFKNWLNDHNRTVRKGEKAIWILAPVIVAEKDENGQKTGERKVVGFRAVPVFDVSQTDGDPLPENPAQWKSLNSEEVPDGLLQELTDKVSAAGYSLSFEELDGNLHGYTSPDGRVVVDSALSPADRALTLAHELAHITLGHMQNLEDYHTGHGGSRSLFEVEAESVAYVLARHYGLASPGTSSFTYIAGWAQGDAKKVSKTADRVLAAVRELLDS